MSSPAAQPSFILVRRLPDGTLEWIPLEASPQRMTVTPDASYTLIDRANYEAPQTMLAKHLGADLVVQVQGTEVLVLGGFFTAADVAFYPTTNLAGGAGPFSGTPLTPESPVLTGSPGGEQVVWSAAHGDQSSDAAGAVAAAVGAGGQSGGGGFPTLWVGLAAGGLGLALAAGGGGGSGGGSSSGGASGGGDTTPPQITSGATAPAIAENSGAARVVYTATATDAGTVSYSLKAGGDSTAFSINANTGAVTLTGNPDFETKPSYQFTVVAKDAAGNSSEQPVSLAINNLDDTAPTITSGATATPIKENSGSGQVVYTVTSTDTADISTGSTTYSLKVGGDAAAFSINANTGAVTLTGNPDFEAKPSYQFTVVAKDAAGNSSERAVSLAINNVDDTAPTITSGATATPINENSGSGQVVYTVTSTDTGDVSTGNTAYSLKVGGDAAAFSINANTGAITLTGNPDFETKSSYQFTVVAKDAAGNSSERAVSLAINNIDDGPIITSGPTATPINENSGSGQVVYTATSVDPGDTRGTSYSLKAGGDAAAFTINSSTGAVRLTGNPDFETKSSYQFTVVAKDTAGNSGEQPVSLAINNVDEVAPTITSGPTASAINENSGANQVVYTVTSTDPDFVTGTTTTYSLKAGGDAAAFSINANTGAVTLTGNPNFETKPSYSFTVVATDAAGNHSERAVTLAINNLDEVAPTITSGPTASSVNENSGANQVVYTVTSTDTGDISTGSTTYSLKPLVGDVAAFTIDPSSGDVRLTGSPDFEAKSSYSFTVVATDAAGNHSERAVSLAINNVDEVAPTITSGPTASSINENSGANQVVYTVTSTDPDFVTGTTTTYSLKAVGDAAAFGINANSGAVTLTGNPDFETKSSYQFTVVAKDAAGNSSELAVSLAINNVDDTAPTITSGPTASAINENSGANQVVYTVTSTDTGDISTGSTTYSLKAVGDVAAFGINANTGAVTLTGNPNFETKSSYSFTVVATDAAGNHSERAVTLAINNLDEVAPTITSGPTASSVNENSGANQVVYTVTSTDTGDISTGSTTYSLKAVGDVAAFGINANTGAVTLTGNPDFEAKSSYSFTVVATDAAGNHSERAVTLAINNVDEVAPTITSGPTASAINENSGANQVVYTVTSTDADFVTGTTTTYSLKAGGDAAAFSINPSTGDVRLTGNPDFETKSSYSFTVVATDAAGNHNERAVSLAINNVDDTAPTITSGPTASAINENSGSGQVVYTVTSTDTGDISTGSTTYSIKAGGDAAAFGINANTGAVTLTGNPDFETKSSYSFTVVATDAAGNHNERAVSLAINNVDDTAPTITSGATATPIDENSGPGQVVYTVTSTDTGDISTGSTTYSIKAGGDAAAFGINANTGAVTLTGNPDFETKPSYSFTVVATDAAGNHNERAVTLAINDLDEIPPTLTSSTPADDAINVPRGDDIVLTFSENVQAGSGNIIITNGSDIRTIDVTDPQVSISGNHVTINPTADLLPSSPYSVQIDPGALTDVAGNAYAGISDNTSLNFETDGIIIGPLGLTQGLSSDSGRTFLSPVSDSIDIRIAAADATPSTLGSAPDAWAGSVNLGSDARVMLAGSGTDSHDPQVPANQISVVDAAVGGQAPPESNAGLQGSFLADSIHVGTSMPSAHHDGAGAPTHAIALANMPVVILTSQGLA